MLERKRKWVSVCTCKGVDERKIERVYRIERKNREKRKILI